MKKLRIDAINLAGGKLRVAVTTGNGTLPGRLGKMVYVFEDRAQLNAIRQSIERSITDEMMIVLAIASLFPTDPTLTNPQAAEGKIVTVDISGVSNPVSIA